MILAAQREYPAFRMIGGGRGRKDLVSGNNYNMTHTSLISSTSMGSTERVELFDRLECKEGHYAD